MKALRAKRGLRQSTLWFLISPATAVLWSCAVALIAVLFPPGYYERLVGEQDHVFLSLPVVLYVVLCVSAFALGYRLHGGLMSLLSNRRRTLPEGPRPGQHAIIPVVLGVCLVLIPISAYLVVSIASSMSLSGIASALLGNESSLLLRRSAHEVFSEGNVSYVFIATTAIVPWLVWQALDIRSSRRRASAEGYVAVALVCVLLLLIAMSALLVQGKGELLYPVLAALVVWIAFRLRQGRLRQRRLLVAGMGAFVFAIGYFSLVSITRAQASNGVAHSAETLVAFTVGSYNRFAALLDGALAVPGGGGYYWTSWLWEMPVVQNFFDLQSAAMRIFGAIPPSGFGQRTQYIYSAGLDGHLTSWTIFAHSFVDFGWLGFAPFIVYGFLARLVWVAFKDARPWAIVLYPQVLWSLLEWRGTLWIARDSMVAFVLLAVAVGVGE
ncbi:MAG: hypothetical protein H0U55_06090, partial [Rubrobacteraceae bacterium]|nr:hypothetical protein [Rubrobacteraceae bacterium]